MKIRFSQIAIIILIAVTFITYAPSLDNDFIWDDAMVIVKNDFVKSWDNFPRLFTRDYLSSPSDIYDGLGTRLIGAGEITYRPVLTFTYFLDRHLPPRFSAILCMSSIVSFMLATRLLAK